MPLVYKKTKSAFKKNVERLIMEGRKPDQAVAISKKIMGGYKPKNKKLKRRNK